MRSRYGNSSGVYGNRERLASHAESVQEEKTCTQLRAANMEVRRRLAPGPKRHS